MRAAVWQCVVLVLTGLQASLATQMCPLLDCNSQEVDQFLVYNCSFAGCTGVPLDDYLDIDTDVLDLSHNQITVIPELKLPVVYVINFAFNQIVNITDEAFDDCKKLRTLNLTGNNLTSSQIRSRVFDTLNDLEELYLNENQIEIFNSTGVFSIFSILRVLDLSKNGMTYLGEDSVSQLDNLQVLRLSYNRLTELNKGMFLGMWNLKFLYLDHNLIKVLPDHTFATLYDLQVLDLRNNVIENMTYEALVGLDFLEVLHLSHNSLASIDQPQLLDTSRLVSLYLEDIPITDIQPGSFPKSLQKIFIRNTKIKHIVNGTFTGLKSLQEVHIDENPELNTIQHGAFDGVNSSVRIVSLMDNSLWTLSQDLLDWQVMEQVELTGNSWDCDCHLYWMTTLPPHTISDLVCYGPFMLKGRKLSEVDKSDFSCSFLKRHQYEGAIALAVFTSIFFIALIGFLTYRYRARVLPCWYGKERKYESLYETDEADEDDEDSSTATFKNARTVSNDAVGFRLANEGKPPAPTPV